MELIHKRLNFTALALLGAVLFLIWSWNSMEPSIKPDDVTVQATLRAPGEAVNPLRGQEHQWTLEVTLDKRTKHPLHIGEQDWFFQVTPYVQGRGSVSWEFLQGLTGGNSGSPRGDAGFSMGWDGRHVPMVVEALRPYGLSVSEREVQMAPAFGYVGDQFPVRVRYYLVGKDDQTEVQTAYVVYTHYEQRWGKDLSWAVVYPVSR